MPDRYRFWGKVQPPAEQAQVFNFAAPRSSADGTSATIRMYGPIDSWGGPWGVSAEEVSAALDSLPDTVNSIQLRINSPGGEGFEGLAILNMLRAHPAKVTAVVDGLAASAASFIAAGCDETVMSPGAQMMIHDAWGMSIGNAADMKKAGEFLNSVSDNIADLYAEAAGGYRARWRSLMSAETWFTAKESVTAGLADRVEVVPDKGVTVTAGADNDTEPDGDPDDQSGVSNKFDLTVFKYAGRDEAPEPHLNAEASTPDGGGDVEDGLSADEDADDAAEAAPSTPSSTDEDASIVEALLSLQENAARFAFGS